MAEQAAVVVAVGREVRQVPVGLDRWQEVRGAAGEVIGRSGLVFTRDALGHGDWDGRREESVTVAGEVDAREVGRVLGRAAQLAGEHEQDAVAVTVGVTVLVGADGSPDDREELPVRLRALADALEEGRL